MVTFCLQKQLLGPDEICVKVQWFQGGEGAERSDKLVKESGNTIYTAAAQIMMNPFIAGHREKGLPNVNSTNVCCIINFVPCWLYCWVVPGCQDLVLRAY